MNTKDTTITNQEFEKILDDKVLPHIRKVLLEKNKKYKGASFEGGIHAIIGNYYRSRDKSNRYKYLIESFIENGKWDDPFGESIFDTVRDQAGYAIIGLTILTLLDIGPLVETNDELWAKHQNFTTNHEEDYEIEINKPVDQIQQLKNAFENIFLSNEDRPEIFSTIIWKTLLEFLKKNASKDYLQIVEDNLFLREEFEK